MDQADEEVASPDEQARFVRLALLVGRLEGALDELVRTGLLVRPIERSQLEAWSNYEARLQAIDAFFEE